MFQVDSNEVNSQFCSNNFRIEDEPGKARICAIYFSSHSIYFPNTADEFNRSIVKRDRYEWYGQRYPDASKHIFLRDIKKQWYLNGINSDICSIELLVEFLRSETDGFKVVCIGSSAGGYAAVLIGNIIEAQEVYSFNGQFSLWSLIEFRSSEDVDPIVFSRAGDSEVNKFYRVVPFLNSNVCTRYFCSYKGDWDFEQCQEALPTGVECFRFSSSHHGIPFLRSSLVDVFLKSDKLGKFEGTINNPLIFSIKMSGIVSVTLGLLTLMSKKVSRFFKR